MMQRTVRYRVIATITWLLSVAILISAAHVNVAQAQNRAVARACGKELKQQCTGVPVLANNMLECLKKNQEKLSARCVALANNVVRRCERDAAQHCQAVVAGQGNILGCLTTAKRMVSSRCNAALDAAFLRQ
jgi:Cysteine rich repeat